MAKIYDRLLSKNTLREKRWDSFDPQRVNLLGEDSNCMVNFLVIPQKIFFFILWSTRFGCFRKKVLFCQATMKFKMSPLLKRKD